MKIISLIFLISLSFNLHAQKSTFVRVYDLSGKKINKGRIFSVTDTSLRLKGKSEPVDIPVRVIGSVKTKHSGGNYILVGSVVGATSMAVLGAASGQSDPEWLEYSRGEGAAAGAILGGAIGAAIGGLTALFKNSKTYLIDGDLAKWKAFRYW